MGRSDHFDFLHDLDKIAYESGRDVELLFYTFDPSDKNATRDALLRAYPRLVDRNSRVAGRLAADYYAAQREAVASEPYRPVVADAADSEDVREAVRYACGHLYEGGKLRTSAGAACDQLVISSERFLRQRAFETILVNARYDPLRPKCRRYAEACACGFCKERASESFVGASDLSGSLHEFCKCSIDVDFDGSKQAEDEKFEKSALASLDKMSEYEKWYVTREVNGLWRKFKDEPRGIIWVGDFEYSFAISKFNEYEFKRKVLLS